MTLRLTRLDAGLLIANPDGTPSQQFLRQINKAFQEIENEVGALAAAQAAQTAATTAQAAATTAQSTATAAARETARINSYPSPSAVLSAADVGSDCTVTVANHTRVYPVQGDIDVADLAVTGGTVTGLSFSTVYYIYYDDTTLADTTPTYQATTSSATAAAGAAAGRHFVGSVTTPADGGGDTSGGGYQAPGGIEP